MQVLPAALDMIRRDESCELTAYPDATGIPTIGWGHTGPEVHLGMTITQAEAEALFQKDIASFSAGVARLIGNAPTTDAQFSAFVSLAYNIGLGNFQHSTALKRHISGDYAGAADAILWWKTAGGKTLSGLVRRRAEERALYLSDGGPIARTDPAPQPTEDPIVAGMKAVQTQLAAAGLYRGAIDADPGPQTRAAMTAYREARGV